MSTASGAGAGAVPGAGPTTRERPSDLRSAELVSRLLAATPPYLYNMPIVPHSYFFSEMLRSFVHAKNNTDANRINPPQNPNHPPIHRRSRKRSWNQSKISPTLDGSHPKPEWQHRPDPWQIRGNALQDDRHHGYEEKFPDALDSNKNHQQSYEKPLELTINKNMLPKHVNHRIPEQSSDIEEKRDSPDSETQVKMRKSPKIDATNHLKDEKFPGLLTTTTPVPSALSLPPPPPPLWYPPLYPPPYGIDPLNFFIDLRVSGHIYDRKHGNKEVQSVSANLHSEAPQQEIPPPSGMGPLVFENSNTSAFKENVKSNRHMSAFSVPKPRDGSGGNGKHFPINLCHSSSNKFNMKYYDDVDAKLHEKQSGKNATSTHYVMQNLKRIYGDLSNHAEDNGGEAGRGAPEQETSEDLDGADDSDSSETKKKRCKDLRALIGLELVVDYVKGGRVGGNAGRLEPPAGDVEVLEDQ